MVHVPQTLPLRSVPRRHVTSVCCNPTSGAVYSLALLFQSVIGQPQRPVNDLSQICGSLPGLEDGHLLQQKEDIREHSIPELHGIDSYYQAFDRAFNSRIRAIEFEQSILSSRFPSPAAVAVYKGHELVQLRALWSNTSACAQASRFLPGFSDRVPLVVAASVCKAALRGHRFQQPVHQCLK